MNNKNTQTQSNPSKPSKPSSRTISEKRSNTVDNNMKPPTPPKK